MRDIVIFVYFKARPADDERVDAALRSMQAALRVRLGDGVTARFGHRHEEAPGQRTWLECYELSAGFDAATVLATRAEAATSAGLDDLREGPIQVEIFEMPSDASCA